MKLKFLIAAPKYSHQSGGIMVLHSLCDTLNRQGYEAGIVFFHGGTAPNFQWAYSNNPNLYNSKYERMIYPTHNPEGEIRDILENGVVVYPDLIPDNPLGAKRVVRYLLYYNKNYEGSSLGEYVLSFSRNYHDTPDMCLFNSFSDENFHCNGALHWSERSLDLTYFGKGPSFTNCFRIPDTLLVTRTWPEDKNQLGILLRQCRYFFTWDSVTATNWDAVSCGAVPVLLHEFQKTKAECDQSEHGTFPNVKLLNFSDRNSVVGDRTEVDDQLYEMQNKISWYKNSWPERVKQFANDVSVFFRSRE